MHFLKAHTPPVPLGRERGYEGFAYKFAYILLASVANGLAWWLISALGCYLFALRGGHTIALTTGLIAGGMTFVGLLALSTNNPSADAP
ncbi:MAG: hypothetical protein NW223_20870 [Hyphomicrobiaceae bacterium]|nr:hypothetical protein [Hyphomicrobiaceae bacterium]